MSHLSTLLWPYSGKCSRKLSQKSKLIIIVIIVIIWELSQSLYNQTTSHHLHNVLRKALQLAPVCCSCPFEYHYWSKNAENLNNKSQALTSLYYYLFSTCNYYQQFESMDLVQFGIVFHMNCRAPYLTIFWGPFYIWATWGDFLTSFSFYGSVIS